jgi:hypothetical protein
MADPRPKRKRAAATGPAEDMHEDAAGSVESLSRRGWHLRNIAKSASKQKRQPVRLTPTQYLQRKAAKDKNEVQAVVLMLAHAGVVRPKPWLELLDHPHVSLLIHCNDWPGQALALHPYMYPSQQATGWEDISLFDLALDMIQHAIRTYPNVKVLYTASGDSMPVVSAEVLLGVAQDMLGINPREPFPIKKWQAERTRAMTAEGLPPVADGCLGSQWIALTRASAEIVVREGTAHREQLRRAFRSSYAYANPTKHPTQHSISHARLNPDEEFIPYLLHVVGKVPFPAECLLIMQEKTAVDRRRCKECGYNIGHSKVLSVQEEARELAKVERSGALFMRKVLPM